ncbi:HAD superfamily hydrolase (TIGR01484 family) [Nocardioides daedukensis]|uniref:HAD superfamily hydrolase (TIGR01484 family) n=1 Tax=Nocardioides daedukensis TaxID=634462 RepID=A0A7Y9S1Z4_9ACTN|nr:HAD family hydrolase [Nocardioides daedukensis]NYG59524.1 HAD superfamily hydrolase (TIGR01484 family) [Nocardioides daedukensis]
MAEPVWRPKLVALDIDGTLLRWVTDSGIVHGEVPPAVRDAVRRAYDAGAHIVLASGRSLHGMTPIADQLGIPDEGAERLWIVASNGAVCLRYPPIEVLHEETFDASAAVAEILKFHPNALVGVEERGRGYRVNRPFPEGELSGEMIITDVDEIVGEPISRVIIRDPEATVEDFHVLAEKLGLHGTDYVIGWTAWMDLAPVGVSKASGLAHVARELGVEAADALAIGDGLNDLEMFAWAGRSVAMGQAVDKVRAAADHVTLAVDEDGAAVELDSWFG